MQCPECQHEMIQSKTGWMCLNCGHAQMTKPSDIPVTPQDAAGPAVAAVVAADSAGVVLGNRKRGKKDGEAAETPSSASVSNKEVRSEQPVVSPASAEATQAEPEATSDEKPDSTPEPETSNDAAPVLAPEPVSEPAAEPTPEASPEVQSDAPSAEAESPAPEEKIEAEGAPEATPDAKVEPTLAELSSEDHNMQHPAAVGSAADPAAPSADASQTAPKAPMVAATHPQSSASRTTAFILGAFVLLAIIATSYYGFMSPQKPLAVVLHIGSSPTPVIATTDITPSVSVSASPSPAVTPNVEANNAQRQVDLAKYVQAYKATANSAGYFPVTPATISLSLSDPTTGQPYVVSKTAPSALGQIYYWAGGQCGTGGFTPGKTLTKYLALETKLDGQSALYCLDVK